MEGRSVSLNALHRSPSVWIGLGWSKDYGKDRVILAELVHLKEPSTSMGPEPAMDYVRRAVWAMLYGDDACMVSRSPQELTKIMEVVVEIKQAFHNRVGEESRDHAHASTVYTVDYGASRSGRANLQTVVILHLPRGRHDRKPGHVR